MTNSGCLGVRLWEVEDLLADLDVAAAERARTRLRTTLDRHHTDSGVHFDSRAWIVTARRCHRPPAPANGR